MRITNVIALVLFGLVAAEIANEGVDTGQHLGIEARAVKAKKPSNPKPPTTPKPPKKPNRPQNPKFPTTPKIPSKPPNPPSPPKTPTKPQTPTKPTPTPAKPELKGPFTPYLVYTKKCGDKVGNAKLKKLLAKYVKNPAKDIKEHGIKGEWINYWSLLLNAQSVKELQKNKQFGGLEPSGCKGKCFNPHTNLHSERAVPEMVFFSQRKNTLLEDYKGEYHYDDRAGEGVTCYMLDDGADDSIGEFAQERPRWLYPNTLDVAQMIPGTTGMDHGTCMLSKMVGKDHGVAKKCKPVVVKIPSGSKPRFYPDGLSAVINDVRTRKIKKAVLSMSLHWPKEKSTELWEGKMWENLKELARLNVVLVTASGNNAIGNLPEGKNNMEGYPAIMGSSKAPTNRRIPSMIVVGAMNANTGKMWVNSNFDDAKGLPHVFAPGEDVACYLGRNYPEVHYNSGTSEATASVAGLAAYFMSLPGGPTTPTAVKKKIMDTAWRQGSGVVKDPIAIYAPVTGMMRVWNEVTIDTVPERKPPTRGFPWDILKK